MKQNITEPYKEENISKRKPGMDMFACFPVALPTFRSQGHFMIEYNWWLTEFWNSEWSTDT